MKKRGSALIIALLIMATVGGVTFGIGRLFFLDRKITALYENSTIAYYAAESGLEEGMLRYRYKKNTQVPYPNYQENDIMRTNLSDPGSPLAVERLNYLDDVTLPDREIYDINIDYLTYYYGHDADDSGNLGEIDLYETSYDKTYWVEKDETVKLDISEVLDNGADVKFITTADEISCKESLYFEARIIGKVLGQTKEIKIALDPVGQNDLLESIDLTDANRSTDPPIYYLTSMIETIRLTSTVPKINSPAELYLKPIWCGAKIALKVIGNSKITSPYTTIRSVGHFGGVTRTLVANIDRQSGTLYDLYDFVIYQYGTASGGATPP